MNQADKEKLRQILQRRFDLAKQRRKRNSLGRAFSEIYYGNIAQGQMDAYKIIAKDFGIQLQTTGKAKK